MFFIQLLFFSCSCFSTCLSVPWNKSNILSVVSWSRLIAEFALLPAVSCQRNVVFHPSLTAPYQLTSCQHNVVCRPSLTAPYQLTSCQHNVVCRPSLTAPYQLASCQHNVVCRPSLTAPYQLASCPFPCLLAVVTVCFCVSFLFFLYPFLCSS